MDPMTAAILAGIKPHIDAAVTEKFTTMLVDMLAKIAPERLAKTGDQAHPAPADHAPAPSNQRPEGSDSGAGKGQNGAKKNGAPTAAVPSE
jgi:hypothetical protein